MIQQKVCFIGASAVGKTSLIRRYVDGIFSDKYLTTIGVKIDQKKVAVNDENYLLMIWDLEGTDRFCGFQPRYLRGASAFVLVIDHSRPSTFEDAMALFEKATSTSNAKAFIVLNKSDLACQLSVEQLEVLHQMPVVATINTSAKSGDKVDSLFHAIASHLNEMRHAHG